MKALVVYYSRTGLTKKVGEEIAKTLGCDVEEIFDTKDRSGVLGYMIAGRDAMRGKLTKIKETVKDPSQYDLVIIGTPLWAFTVSTPVRTYLTQNKGKFKKTAFYCTEGGSGGAGTLKAMEEASGCKPVSSLELKAPDFSSGGYKEKAVQFSKGLV
ncbi:MAG: flavodoxin [Candidatus Altiarchaeota archaeon]